MNVHRNILVPECFCRRNSASEIFEGPHNRFIRDENQESAEDHKETDDEDETSEEVMTVMMRMMMRI